MQCFCHLNYYLCGTELWCRKIPPHAKKCPRLYGDVIHFSFIVSGALILFANPIYHLFTTDQVVVDIGVHMIRFLIPSYAIYVVIGILSGALRGAGRVLVPMILTCGGVCLLRIIWLFAFVRSHPGIESIMLSYPVSWIITAVLFVIYYFRRFPGMQKKK